MNFLKYQTQTHRLLFLIIVAAALVAGAFRIAGAQTAGTGSGTAALDHFKCYVAQGTAINDLVFLRDQFGVQDKKFERDIVRDPRFFCNPVAKIHAVAGSVSTTSITNMDGHLTWYSIKPAIAEHFVQRTVIVKNQFAPNGQQLLVIAPRFIAVPTQKVSVNEKPTEQGFPKGLDHFKCYQVEAGQMPQQTVKLWDQFSTPSNATGASWSQFDVVRAQYLCNPVAKIHVLGFGDGDTPQVTTTTIQHPNDHLVCYALIPNTAVARSLVINNQFGQSQKLTTSMTKLLCVPSEKRVVSTNGRAIDVNDAQAD